MLLHPLRFAVNGVDAAGVRELEAACFGDFVDVAIEAAQLPKNRAGVWDLAHRSCYNNNDIIC